MDHRAGSCGERLRRSAAPAVTEAGPSVTQLGLADRASGRADS